MKRKYIGAMILIFIFLFAAVPHTLAASKYASEPVFMREGPGTKYKIIIELQTGDEVDVAGSSGNWSKIVFDGKTGYVFSKYLSSENYTGTKQATITANINVRSGAGTNFKKLGSLKKGATIQVVKSEGNWSSFVYNGKLGYVHNDYITMKQAISANDVFKKLQDGNFYTKYADELFGVITNDTNTEVTIIVSNTKKATQLKDELAKTLLGLPYKVVHTSLPDNVDQKYLSGLAQTILKKYNALSTIQKSQYIVAEAHYDATDDKFYVSIVNLDKTKEKLFKQQISSWPYITFVSVSEVPRPKT